MDAVLGGINTPSSEVILPALQIIKAKVPNHLVSSVFLMQTKDQQNYIFTDCGLNVNPTPEQLSQIADLGYRAAVFFHLPSPQIAFLSYSTGHSGKGASVEKVRTTVANLASSKWNLCPFEGPIQFDAAMSITTRFKKLPNTQLAKIPTNILVFPDLNAGNIGYKIAQ